MVNIENIINDYIKRAQLPFLSQSKRELLREAIITELQSVGVEFELGKDSDQLLSSE